MAVRIINEKAFDKNFNKRMDDYWDELNKDYRDDKYNHDNLENVEQENGIAGIDKYTGKLILNRVEKYLQQKKYQVQVSFNDSKENILKAISNSLNNRGEIEDKYNGFLRATFSEKRELNFKDSKRNGLYNIYFVIEVFIRNGYGEVGDSLDNKSKNSKCEVLIRDNLREFPFNDQKEVYDGIIKIITDSIKSQKTEKYWNIKDQNIFSTEDFVKCKQKR